MSDRPALRCVLLDLDDTLLDHRGAVADALDRHDLDVVPARAAGLRAIHLDRHGAGPLDEPERVTTLTAVMTRPA
ncbi:hypothetical protein [Actinoplanes sp. URMC 104]|uniref:hypothetical protein n=1 Tax=Actinoplanes sp. URMC 104 TaxID=3423409 RepID=UPI003F1B4A89